MILFTLKEMLTTTVYHSLVSHFTILPKTLREVRKQANEYGSNTYNLHLSLKDKGVCTPFPSKAEPGYSGIMTHEQKGADSWETCNDYSTDIQKEQTRILQMTQNNITD